MKEESEALLETTAVLYQQYGPAVFRRCMQLLRNTSEAEDMVQETFIKVHRFRAQFKGESSVYAWLIRIANNTCIDYIRSQSRRRVRNQKSEEQRILASESKVFGAEHILVMRDRIQKGLSAMPKEDAELLVMHYFDEFDTKEIAEMLSMNVRTVQRRLKKIKGNVTGEQGRMGIASFMSNLKYVLQQVLNDRSLMGWGRYV